MTLFQSTRPVWGATISGESIDNGRRVSIHAPRVGRDISTDYLLTSVRVSIHAPRVGRDTGHAPEKRKLRCFNPRAPCGARRESGAKEGKGKRFQSTRPVWGATLHWISKPHGDGVSIHAPRVGRDETTLATTMAANCFNPRAPCGARRERILNHDRADWFQSTRPVWGATCGSSLCCRRGSCFNPRAPCGARPSGDEDRNLFWGFNPRAPCGARLVAPRFVRDRISVSIHAPRVGRDVTCAPS